MATRGKPPAGNACPGTGRRIVARGVGSEVKARCKVCGVLMLVKIGPQGHGPAPEHKAGVPA